MGLFILCTCIYEAEQILEAIFTIILSKFDGPILSEICNSIADTPCAEKKKFLSKLISNKKHYLEFEEQINTEYHQTNDDGNGNDNNTNSSRRWRIIACCAARSNPLCILCQKRRIRLNSKRGVRRSVCHS